MHEHSILDYFLQKGEAFSHLAAYFRCNMQLVFQDVGILLILLELERGLLVHYKAASEFQMTDTGRSSSD